MRHILMAAVVLVGPTTQLSPPVDGPVARHFEAPAGEYGPGHRGVDLAAPPGTPVRAAASGRVVFAGAVARARHVVVAHAGGLRSSYSYLRTVIVAPGASVERGAVLGTSGGQGPRHAPGVVHFGVRRDGRYIDPAPLIGLGRPRIRLAPVERSRSQGCPSPAGTTG